MKHRAKKVGYRDGLINGYSDGTFRSNKVVTGDQFLAMMYLAFSDANGSFKQSFLDDVKEYNPSAHTHLLNIVDKLIFNFSNDSKRYWAQSYINLA